MQLSALQLLRVAPAGVAGQPGGLVEACGAADVPPCPLAVLVLLQVLIELVAGIRVAGLVEQLALGVGVHQVTPRSIGKLRRQLPVRLTPAGSVGVETAAGARLGHGFTSCMSPRGPITGGQLPPPQALAGHHSPDLLQRGLAAPAAIAEPALIT